MRLVSSEFLLVIITLMYFICLHLALISITHSRTSLKLRLVTLTLGYNCSDIIFFLRTSGSWDLIPQRPKKGIVLKTCQTKFLTMYLSSWTFHLNIPCLALVNRSFHWQKRKSMKFWRRDSRNFWVPGHKVYLAIWMKFAPILTRTRILQ